MKNRRLLCLLLAVVLLLVPMVPVTSYAGSFVDVTGHWAEFYISKAFDEKLIAGYPGGYFQPDKSVTRAEFAAMVNKTFRLSKIDRTSDVNYKDVNASSWYYKDIERAITAGYTGGYSDNTFRPNNPITREEAAVMLSKLITSGKKGGSIKAFSDAASINSWAKDAFAELNGKGYIGAYSDNKIHPSDPLTRAQTSKILSDILDNEDIVTSKTKVDTAGTTLSGKTYVGDVVIDSDLGEGKAVLDNCVILGDLIIEGGSSVTLNNTSVISAEVNKDDKTVAVSAKGTSGIQELEARQICSLQAAGKGSTGFPEVSIKKQADVTLKGTFPNVTIDGSKALFTVASGQISHLLVTSAGEHSDIILSGKSVVSDAAIHAECYFHGTGTITLLNAYAGDITYETKPDKMVVALATDRPVSEGEDDLSVTFKPKNKTDDVDIDTTITATFNTSILLANGGAVSGSNVTNFLTLHAGSTTGTAVACTAAINGAKKVITLKPNANLQEFTKYYLILTGSAIKNIGGNLNDAEKLYFTTGGTVPKLNNYAVTTTGTSITASFTPNVTGSAYILATTSATAPSAADIIATGKSVSALPGTPASITLTGMTEGTTYYVYGLLENSNKVQSSVISASTTVAATYSTLATLTLAVPGGSNLISGFSPAVKDCTVTVPLGTTTVDVTASSSTASNTNPVVTINGTTGTSAPGIAVTTGTTTTITVTVSSDNKTTSTYTINVTVAAS